MAEKRCDEYVEEVEAMSGVDPARICYALGLKPGSVAKAMYRAGRPDLAAPFNALDWHSRKHKLTKLCAPCKLNIHQAHNRLRDSYRPCKCGFCKTVTDNVRH